MTNKTAKRIVGFLYIIFTAAIIPLAWYGLFKHEQNPGLFWIFFCYCFFLVAWWGGLGEELLFQLEWNIMRKRPADKPEAFEEQT